MSEAAKNEDKVKNLPNEESDDEDDNGDEKGKDNKHGSESAKSKRMKKALESIGNLTGSTHSNSDVISTIMSAQHKVFGPLKLEDLGPEEKSRSRTHVNPLSIQFLEPTQGPENWNDWYDNPSKPLGIDIGCAAGRFALLMASGLAGEAVPEEFRDINHLGLEIRRPLVERANLWAKGKDLDRRLKFVVSSANVSLATVIKGYAGPIKFVAVQFPDPHFKRKHHKRRVVNESFIKMVSEILPAGGYFFVQSDVEEAAAQMRDRIDAFPNEFSRVGEYTPRDPKLVPDRVRSGEGEEYWTRDGKRALDGGKDYGDWKIGPNPTGVPTEREVQNEALGLPIYRALFKRNPK